MRSDLRALEVHLRLQAHRAAAALVDFEALSQSIAAFDFAKAATQCEQMMQKLERVS
jgi:hypothetical protein